MNVLPGVLTVLLLARFLYEGLHVRHDLQPKLFGVATRGDVKVTPALRACHRARTRYIQLASG